MISKWERGLKWPSRMYVRLLSAFFDLAIPEFRMVLGSPGPSEDDRSRPPLFYRP